MTDDQNAPLPWSVNWDAERVLVDANGQIIGMMDTEELATRVAEVMSAGDGDIRAELTAQTRLVGLYKDRDKMTPSERQSYFGETVAESIQPERGYMDEYAPMWKFVAAVREALAGIALDPADTDSELAAMRAALTTVEHDMRNTFH